MNFDSFTQPSSPGLYCCFAFDDAENILGYQQDGNLLQIYRTIELASRLPAYDYSLRECQEYLKNSQPLSENHFLRGYFHVKENEKGYSFVYRVLQSLQHDPQSRRWWRRHNNEPVHLFAESVPFLGKVPLPSSSSQNRNTIPPSSFIDEPIHLKLDTIKEILNSKEIDKEVKFEFIYFFVVVIFYKKTHQSTQDASLPSKHR
jgi:hypothetical protein